MDQVAVATVNAAVLTIYEAVLVLVFGYAQRPAQRLKREGHLVEQALAAARQASREFAEELQSEQLAAMVPDDPVRALALTNRLLEPDRPAVSPVWDVEEGHGFKGPELWLSAEDRAVDLGARAAYDKLRTEGDQGLVLLAILSWYAQREPFTGYHLGSVKGIAAWRKSLTSGQNKVGLMAFRLRANLQRAELLTSAAVQQAFWLSDDEYAELHTAPKVNILQDRYSARLKFLTAAAPKILNIYGSLFNLSDQLDGPLYEYRRDAPRLVTRVLLVAGLIGGAVAFFSGVVAPLTFSSVSSVIYAWIPAVWYCVILIVICAVAIRRALEF
jgi:hypothetical protein